MHKWIQRSRIASVFWALGSLMLALSPAKGWEMRPGQVCELTHQEGETHIRITYDLANTEYAIAITLDRSWPMAPLFAIQFAGQRDNTISTDRHVLSNDQRTLTVTDKGFGNVLNGIEFNNRATAILSDQAVSVSLIGAAPAVQAFRACARGMGV